MWPDEKNKHEGWRRKLPRPPSEPGRDNGGLGSDRQTGMGTGEMDGPIMLSRVRKARQMVSLKKPARMRKQGSALERGHTRRAAPGLGWCSWGLGPALILFKVAAGYGQALPLGLFQLCPLPGPMAQKHWPQQVDCEALDLVSRPRKVPAPAPSSWLLHTVFAEDLLPRHHTGQSRRITSMLPFLSSQSGTLSPQILTH